MDLQPNQSPQTRSLSPIGPFAGGAATASRRGEGTLPQGEGVSEGAYRRWRIEDRTGFSWDTARVLAEASAMAYAPVAASGSLAVEPGGLPGGIANFRAAGTQPSASGETPDATDTPQRGPTMIENAATGAAAIIQDRGNCIVVAFRGSRAPKDFVADAECWRSRLPLQSGTEAAAVALAAAQAAEVHHGFLRDWESVATDVILAVKQILNSSPITHHYSLFITGHSLGGALAILCALEFARQGLPVAGVHTFGQPRVGNAAFGRFYEDGGLRMADGKTLADVTFRVVNQNDIVPRMPPWINGYRHCGQEIFLLSGQVARFHRLVACATQGWALNPPWWARGLSDALGLWSAWRRRNDVLLTKHPIAEYRKQISDL